MTSVEHNETVTRIRRRLLAVLTGVCSLALVTGGATWWWRWDTARQPHVGGATAAMDRALADAVTAAGPGAAVAIGPAVPSAACRLGPLHHGHVFTAKADLYTNPGGEDALLTAMQQRLPPGDAATRGTAVGGVRPLRASVDAAVSLAVEPVSPGWLTVDVRSQCSLGTAAAPGSSPGRSDGTDTLATVLQRLGTRAATTTQQRVPCGSGSIVTLSAISEATDTSHLDARLGSLIPAGATRFATAGANRVTYRAGNVSVIVAASDDGTEITAQYTSSC